MAYRSRLVVYRAGKEQMFSNDDYTLNLTYRKQLRQAA